VAKKPVMRISGVQSLQSKLRLMQAVVPKKGVTQLQKGAEKVAKLASMYAPVDEGNLEASIKAGKVNNTVGPAEVSVFVDTGMLVPEKPGVMVGDYAWMMHEGVYNLGPKSEEKEDELGVEVGPKFLTRALRDMRPHIIEALEKILRPSQYMKGRRKK
jgi:hypothetical protein